MHGKAWTLPNLQWLQVQDLDIRYDFWWPNTERVQEYQKASRLDPRI